MDNQFTVEFTTDYKQPDKQISKICVFKIRQRRRRMDDDDTRHKCIPFAIIKVWCQVGQPLETWNSIPIENVIAKHGRWKPCINKL